MKKIFSFQYTIVLLLILSASAVITGCNKEVQVATPAPPSNEFLTTVLLKLQNTANATDTLTAVWKQLDPTGAADPDTSGAVLNLAANSTYTAQVVLLDETKTPADTVSNEIRERANYHLFFFQPTPVSAAQFIVSATTTNIPGTPVSASGPYLNLVVSRTDLDTNTPPMQVGLDDQFVTGDPGTGTLRVVLRHQPNVKDGSYLPGSSDLDVNYQVTIH